MTEDEGLRLFERIGATAIANQAILKCTLSGFPLTVDNVILFVGDLVDPTNEAAANLISLIGIAIEELIDCRDLMSNAGFQS
ncbi:hypothetical protein [Rhizobium sp. RM]|uniref:hypothetical protein n=1 Tax=Rhizobium sp. RM TaxID=2748079 RepID=UPI00110DDA82|nr:hypothetical protein [Rhizobium sp. RM]NWJ27527.1 hypothetical protein [Rhizobium sp. RM]TMV20010.1 hypothetical protein BJG94_11510 [Rhizobium sp. Td3]